MSVGCGMAPPGTDSAKDFVKHEVHITGLDPVYLKGGMYYDTSGGYDLSFRPYGVRLPANYDPTKPYAVTVGGGGCGGNAANFATNPGGGLQIAPNGATLQIGLSYINGCFNDGGPAIGNRTDTPEEPYFRAVMADIEAHYCIDLSKVYMAGYSSGGWESYTLSCAASDLIRGMGADEGGLRTMHPVCKNAVAAVLVAGEADDENPIGPLDPNNATDKGAIDRLGSFGSAPGRDELLMRNGCNGSTTAPYTPAAGGTAYPECVKYTGCPNAYPVIWCALPGVGHNSSTYNGLNYSPGPMWDVLGALPAP
jgi:poly(3-hydroxybutyrate) depolymerase